MREHRGYSKEEIRRIQQEFKATVSRARKRRKIINPLVATYFLLGFVFILIVPDGYKYAAVAVGIISRLVFVYAGHKLSPPLKCPGCRQDVENHLEKHCPDCGGNSSLKSDSMFSHRKHCTHCNRKLLFSRNGIRNFRVRYCTHCAVRLDLSRSGF